MESKYFKTENTGKGTRIFFKDPLLYTMLPKKVFFFLEKPIINLFSIPLAIPFAPIGVSFGLSTNEFGRVLDKYCEDLEELSDIQVLDPQNYALPYPSTGVFKANMVEGITFDFKTEKDIQPLLIKMDKAVEKFRNK
ncbi:hypothetical protein [Bacillus toyonensis]|uniref:hypothetical protein n=1 Tax=Bacillus toyonensis TaxID=155322 RepID=UPI000BF7C5D3|nr:hypothetical protein [Bacillus toyonensis]PGF05052.1 hypothetical protein COM61_01045 [Bacillus toyonensis]